jgi:His/Glu/Gln/Arg/opine family amino acid ABC transporter permease subunit
MDALDFISAQQHKLFLDILGTVKYISQGIFTTLFYSILAAFFGIILGSLLAILRYTNNTLLVLVVKLYTSVIRGTPFLLQLFFIYFALPGLLKINIPIFIAGIAALSINSAAYVAEIVRGGIDSVDKGQVEAAKSLSIPYFPMMLDIILPQALKSILPSLINEVINLIKESAVIGVIGVADLMRRAQIIAAEKYDFITPLCIAGIIYYLLICVIARFGIMVEKKLK